jgi:hypothetical protein
MPCKIIAQTSTRHTATYLVEVGGRVYKAGVEDFPSQTCTVHVDDLERGSELFRSIEAVVLKDWLGIDTPNG